MWPFKRKKKEPEYNQFIHQISEIDRLERDNQELYRFCMDACKEIYKYTGKHDWHEKLNMMVKARPAT